MNKTLKAQLKKICYGTLKRTDVLCPKASAWMVKRFYKLRALNDLKIYEQEHYDSLGTYTTLYASPPKQYKAFLKTYTYDENGLPLYVYEGSTSYEIVQMAQFGLMEYGYSLAKENPIHIERAIKAANWLVTSQDERGGWSCSFDYPCPEVSSVLRKGWYTAMGQGQAISLLVRAYSVCPRESYRKAAHNALKLLEIPVSEGGLYRTFHGYDFYEEYPTDIPSFTLNGLLFCMIGLYDGWNKFDDEKAKELLDRAFRTLRYMLPFFDDETITSYDLSHITNAPREKLRSHKYHRLHVKLLQSLYSVRPHEILAFYIEKWNRVC